MWSADVTGLPTLVLSMGTQNTISRLHKSYNRLSFRRCFTGSDLPTGSCSPRAY